MTPFPPNSTVQLNARNQARAVLEIPRLHEVVACWMATIAATPHLTWEQVQLAARAHRLCVVEPARARGRAR